MAANKAIERAVAISFPVPSTVLTGDPLLVGIMPGVAETSYGAQANPTGNVTVDMEGAFFLSVTAATVLSPQTGSAVKPGQALYADGGTLDSTTNVRTGFTIDKASGGVFFGYALDAIPSGDTAIIRVRIGSTPTP
jgi:predicted RecA/RadA family phage recombinase